MNAPVLTSFVERLRGTLDEARARGTLTMAEYEALLVDPDFDDREFEAFRARCRELGIRQPVDDDGDEAPADLSTVRDEPERDLLDLYLSEIGRIPMLPHATLLETARRARLGDEQARKHVIVANLRLVVHLARGYRNRGLPMLDLIEEGNLGLIHGVDRFDPERGLRFSTYAAIWIRQAIVKGIAEQSRSVRIPVQMFQQVNRFVRADRALRARLGRDPELAEIAIELGISMVRTERLAGLIRGLRSLDDGSSLAAYEQLTNEDLLEGPPSVERLVEIRLEHEKIDRLLRSLGTREEQILRIRFGFHDGAARTLQQTGEHFRITRERVRQIEAQALEKLRRAIELQDMDRARGTIVQ